MAWGDYENGTALCSTWDAAAPGHWVNDTASGPHRRFDINVQCAAKFSSCSAVPHATSQAVPPSILPAAADPAAQQPPADEAVSTATQQLCSASPSAALALLTQALGQGGINASATLMAVSLDECPDNRTMLVGLSDFAKVPELQTSATVMR